MCFALGIQASKMMQTFASLLEGIVRDVQDYTEKERKSVLSLKSLTETVVQSEVRSLSHLPLLSFLIVNLTPTNL